MKILIAEDDQLSSVLMQKLLALDPEELSARLRVADRILGLQAEMKQLQGLLSICSYCKNIREARDRWVSIEQYVSQRANTVFSRGICPRCAAEHFPEVE